MQHWEIAATRLDWCREDSFWEVTQSKAKCLALIDSNEYFVGLELELLGQADGLTAVIQKDFRLALHGDPPAGQKSLLRWHIHRYMPTLGICSERALRIW